MPTTLTKGEAATDNQAALRPPARLHHNNFYSRDLEATRHFYEDIIGLKLRAFWVEHLEEAQNNGGPAFILGHAFFGLADGGMLAFMHADGEMKAKLESIAIPETVHVALKVDADQQQGILARLVAESYEPPKYFEIDHVFVRSLYVYDPDGLLVEFAVDPEDAEEMYQVRSTQAHETLRKYIAGDRTPTAPKKS